MKKRDFLPLALAICFAAPELNASVIAYPEKGQSTEQQAKDTAECAQWATQQTGISPEQLLQQQQQAAGQTQAPNTSAAKGAGRGAAVGALGGAISGNAGAGAAAGAGAGIGAVGGGIRRRQQEQQAQQQQQAGQAAIKQQMATYDTAKKTCLKGKGYSVG